MMRRAPCAAVAVLALALGAQLAWRLASPLDAPAAEPLGAPPSATALRVASLGEPAAAARLAMLHVQAHDDQAGRKIALGSIDYTALRAWLGTSLDLDPRSAYPLLAATRVYGAVADPARVRLMLDFVEQRFGQDPTARWPWLAEARLAARYRLRDDALAQRYANRLRQAAPQLPAWARTFAMASDGGANDPEDAAAELRARRELAGALILHGGLRDANEARHLAGSLGQPEPGRTIHPAPPAPIAAPE